MSIQIESLLPPENAEILFRPKYVNPSCPEIGIFRAKYVNIMADDTLSPCVARTSAATVLNMQDKGSLSTATKDFIYLRHLNVEKWWNMQNFHK